MALPKRQYNVLLMLEDFKFFLNWLRRAMLTLRLLQPTGSQRRQKKQNIIAVQSIGGKNLIILIIFSNFAENYIKI
jgi:hypothetical protein